MYMVPVVYNVNVNGKKSSFSSVTSSHWLASLTCISTQNLTSLMIRLLFWQILSTKSIPVLKQQNLTILCISLSPLMFYYSVIQSSCLPSPFCPVHTSLIEFGGRRSFTANFTSLILNKIQMNSRYRICSNVKSMNRLLSPCVIVYVGLNPICSFKLAY